MLSYFFGKSEPVENADPVLAMQDQLDSHGEFYVEEDGSMRFKDFIFLRSVILRQALRKWQPEKERLSSIAVELLKKGSQAERDYASNHIEQTQKHAEILMEMTNKACDHIEYNTAGFHKTIQKVQKNKKDLEEMQLKEIQVKKQHQIEHCKFKGTKDDALKGFEFKSK